MVGIVGLFGLLLTGSSSIFGVGYQQLAAGLQGGMTLKIMLILGVFKLAATVVSYSSGSSGGIFGPSLYIGGMLGGVVGILANAALSDAHAQPGAVMALLDQVRSEVAVLPAPPFSRTPNTFTHIFSGGYAAGYYSYKWAEVLSADAYAAFEETVSPDGAPSIETGRRYRQQILEAGGSRTAMESFKAFRGREPQLDALLRHQGMAEPLAA